MNFTKIDPYHVKSECGMYVINKASVGGLTCYMAVHRARTILGTWRCEPDDRATAYNAAIEACRNHASAPNGVP